MNKDLKTNNNFHLSHFQSKFNPISDGVDHINIYSRGATSLGRQLSHFTYMPFEHPQYGSFVSLEGFWHWLRNGCNDDELRNLSGMPAKQRGRSSESHFMPHFRDEIIAANYQKIIQHPSLKEEFINSTLPFAHYYVMPDGTDNLIRPGSGSDWIIDGIEILRYEMKEGKVPVVWTRCMKRHSAINATPYVPPTAMDNVQVVNSGTKQKTPGVLLTSNKP